MSAWFRPALAAIAVVLLSLIADSSGLLAPVDRWLGDLRYLSGKRAASGDIVVADIDSKSLHDIGTWPWPRHIHAELIDKLNDLGAAQIAFDVDFSAASNPADDTALADALKRAGGSVILASFAQAPTGQIGDLDLTYNVPIPAFLANAWTASVNVLPDPDGHVRSLRYGGVIAGEATQSLSAMLSGQPVQSTGGFPIDFSIRADTIERLSVIDILRGKVDRSRIEGKTIVIGASAVELRDLFQVPHYGIVSGSLLQVLGAETLIQNRVISDAGSSVGFAGLALIAILFTLVFGRFRWSLLTGGTLFLALGIEAAATLAQVQGLIHIDTAMWHISLFGLAIFVIGSEIDVRGILLLISRNETRNVRTILEQVISDNFAGVLVVNEDGTIESASRSALTLLGLPQRELAGDRVESIVPAKLARATRSALASADPAFTPAAHEVHYARADGASRILEYVVTPSRLAGGVSQAGEKLPDRVVATLTFVDVTERRAAEERVAYLARFDTLTGLPNRNHFEEKLEGALQRYRETGKNCAVLFFDLDRFKAVNDTLGHDYGDRLLTAVARRLLEVVRGRPDGDTIARFGGDEYAVLMAGPLTPREAEILADRLIATVGEPYELDGHRLIVGLSVGIALPRAADMSVGTLMKNADAALYRAKGSGGGISRVFDASIETLIRAHREMEVALWDAFERDEFEIFYQPQVNLHDGSILGVEALLRWRRPDGSYVSPSDFVPVAEAVGLIAPLGHWVLEHAAMEVARWPVPLKLAVNVSPVQFVKGDLAMSVEGVLTRSGLPAERLDLEITESLFLQENRSITETIEKLRALGVSFAIDDFGTGYSSLGYVRKFPVEKIKIDQTFVRGLPHDNEAAAIVGAVCALARGLNIGVLAEGIETEEQAAALRLFGCGEGQGFLFGRPQPGAAILALLETDEARERRSA